MESDLIRKRIFSQTPTKVEVFLAWLYDELASNPALWDEIIRDYYTRPLDSTDYTYSREEQ